MCVILYISYYLHDIVCIILQSVANITFGSGSYEEASDYCGRVLMSVEIEDREGSKV